MRYFLALSSSGRTDGSKTAGRQTPRRAFQILGRNAPSTGLFSDYFLSVPRIVFQRLAGADIDLTKATDGTVPRAGKGRLGIVEDRNAAENAE